MTEDAELMDLTQLDSICPVEFRRMLVFGGGKMALAIVEGILRAGIALFDSYFGVSHYQCFRIVIERKHLCQCSDGRIC